MAEHTPTDAPLRRPAPTSEQAARAGTRSRGGTAAAGEPTKAAPAAAKKAAVKKAAAKKAVPANKAVPAKKAESARKAEPAKKPEPAAKAAAKKAEPVKKAVPAKKAEPAAKAAARKAEPAVHEAAPATKSAPAPRKKAPAKNAPAAVHSAKEYEGIRDSLAERLTELRSEYERAMADINDLQRDRVGDMAGDDQADTGTKTFEREQEISLANGILDRMSQVEHALDRLATGTYGFCERCGNPIPQARLEAFPSVTLCVSCKQHEERR